MRYKYIKEFREALVGWTVVEVEEPTFDEGLCELALEHPTGLRKRVALSATDMGAWIQWEKDEAGRFKSFSQLAEEAGEYVAQNLEIPDENPYTLKRAEDVLIVSVSDGQCWSIKIDDIEDEWRWVLDPGSSDNDLEAWMLGFCLTKGQVVDRSEALAKDLDS